MIFVQGVYKITHAFLWKFKCKILGKTISKYKGVLKEKRHNQIIKSIILYNYRDVYKLIYDEENSYTNESEQKAPQNPNTYEYS